MTSQNPFETEENLKFWFELNPSYILAKKASFKNYIQFNKPQNNSISQQLNMSFTQLTTWISKHAILATSIFLILTSTIGVFAAEGLAPKEYKPSTIISGKQESSSISSSSSSSSSVESSSSVSSESSSSATSNITQSEPPLTADNGYSVENLDQCGLSARFKKTVQRQSQFELQKFQPDLSTTYSKLLKPISVLGYFGGEGSGPGVGFGISCYDGNYSVDDFNKQFTQKLNGLGYFDSESMPVNVLGPVKKEVIEKQAFCTEVGFTQISCEKINSQIVKITKPGADGPTVEYFMNYGGKTFIINNFLYGITLPAFNYTETLTLQFITPSNGGNLQTYTNPFFPDFKLVYPNDWKFETSTSESQYKGLSTRNIKLVKNGVTLSFDSVPAFPTGCGGPSGLDYVSKENVTSDINRFLFKDGTIIYVRGDNPSCRIGLNLLSNM
jgi:hypothetical protein